MHFDVDSDVMGSSKKKFFIYRLDFIRNFETTILVKVVSSLKLMYVSPIIFDFESITKRGETRS